MPDSDCRDKHELENLTYTLEEVDNTNEKVTYNQLVREVDLLEMTSEMQFDTLMAKEKPQAGMLKKYSHAELSSVADGAPAKEKPEAGMLKMYSQGELSKVADGK